MRKLLSLLFTLTALGALAIGPTTAGAEGRHYHTIISSHRFKLEGCMANGLMYLRTDARHNRRGALTAVIRYTVTVAGFRASAGEFGAFAGRRLAERGHRVNPNSVVRFRVKLTGIKRVRIKSLTVPQIGRC